MKKILHIINGLGKGGAETSLVKLLHLMQGKPYTFLIVSLTDQNQDNFLIQEIKNLNISIYHFQINKFNFFLKWFQLICLIRQFKPDVAQTWLYFSDLIGGLSAKLCGVRKIIWSIRCEGIHLNAKNKVLKKINAFLSRYIPDIICSNSEMAVKNHISAGYDIEKMQVIYNGYDDSLFYPQKAQAILRHSLLNQRLPSDSILIGALGRFHPDKGYADLISIIDTVIQQYPAVFFILCGRGCDENNSVFKAFLQKVHHADRLLFLPGTHQPAAYLNMLDIFILPSKTESFPNVLAEAMLCALPCIATDTGAVKGILGETGILVPTAAPEALAQACLTLLMKSSEERMALGMLARKRIQKEFSIACFGDNMASLYDR